MFRGQCSLAAHAPDVHVTWLVWMPMGCGYTATNSSTLPMKCQQFSGGGRMVRLSATDIAPATWAEPVSDHASKNAPVCSWKAKCDATGHTKSSGTGIKTSLS